MAPLDRSNGLTAGRASLCFIGKCEGRLQLPQSPKTNTSAGVKIKPQGGASGHMATSSHGARRRDETELIRASSWAFGWRRCSVCFGDVLV